MDGRDLLDPMRGIRDDRIASSLVSAPPLLDGIASPTPSNLSDPRSDQPSSLPSPTSGEAAGYEAIGSGGRRESGEELTIYPSGGMRRITRLIRRGMLLG